MACIHARLSLDQNLISVTPSALSCAVRKRARRIHYRRPPRRWGEQGIDGRMISRKKTLFGAAAALFAGLAAIAQAQPGAPAAKPAAIPQAEVSDVATMPAATS